MVVQAFRAVSWRRILTSRSRQAELPALQGCMFGARARFCDIRMEIMFKLQRDIHFARLSKCIHEDASGFDETKIIDKNNISHYAYLSSTDQATALRQAMNTLSHACFIPIVIIYPEKEVIKVHSSAPYLRASLQ
jgi:hypothetical protein